jgi:hypothetical protein
MDVVPTTASSDEISRLTIRVRELEAQHAAELDRRHRAEQALANTQFELLEARRRASEAERTANEVGHEADSSTRDAVVPMESGNEAAGTITPVQQAPLDGTPPMVSSLVSRLSRLRDELGAEHSTGRGETEGPPGHSSSGESDGLNDDESSLDAPSGPGDDGLRERLSSAANARHRGAGLGRTQDASPPAT